MNQTREDDESIGANTLYQISNDDYIRLLWEEKCESTSLLHFVIYNVLRYI